ncbi:hypothetical protein [Pedobacter sp. CG_S7]
MKAIHNISESSTLGDKVGNYKLKYNFESNSQLEAITLQEAKGWEL